GRIVRPDEVRVSCEMSQVFGGKSFAAVETDVLTGTAKVFDVCEPIRNFAAVLERGLRSNRCRQRFTLRIRMCWSHHQSFFLQPLLLCFQGMERITASGGSHLRCVSGAHGEAPRYR